MDTKKRFRPSVEMEKQSVMYPTAFVQALKRYKKEERAKGRLMTYAYILGVSALERHPRLKNLYEQELKNGENGNEPKTGNSNG